MQHSRRRSDILVNTYHMNAILSIPPEKRSNVSAERHAVLICEYQHSDDAMVREILAEAGFDPDITLFFWDGDESQADHCIGTIQHLKNLGYDHGFHFDNDQNRVAKILEAIPGTRIVSLCH